MVTASRPTRSPPPLLGHVRTPRCAVSRCAWNSCSRMRVCSRWRLDRRASARLVAALLAQATLLEFLAAPTAAWIVSADGMCSSLYRGRDGDSGIGSAQLPGNKLLEVDDLSQHSPPLSRIRQRCPRDMVRQALEEGWIVQIKFALVQLLHHIGWEQLEQIADCVLGIAIGCGSGCGSGAGFECGLRVWHIGIAADAGDLTELVDEHRLLLLPPPAEFDARIMFWEFCIENAARRQYE